MKKDHRTARLVLLALLMTLGIGSRAQQPPDSGTILRQQPAPPVAPARPAPLKAPVPAAAPEVGGPRILVKGFRIRGATLIPEEELAAQLRDSIGQEFTFGQLKARALVLVGYYAQKGYLARVIVPPQEVKDGIVELQVIEGTRGSLDIERKGERIDAQRVRRFIESRLSAGAPMNLSALGEALNILNEQPGIGVTSSLAPGKGESDVDVAVDATQRPLTAYSLGLNNSGSRATGEYQASAAATLNNPTGHFDSASALVNAAQGSDYGRFDYSLAVGDRGLRVGANASSLHYRLVQTEFKALQASGTADTWGLVASYPLARRNDLNLSAYGGFDGRRLMDRTFAGETSNRKLHVYNAGLGGYAPVQLAFVHGFVPFGATLGWGDIDQGNPTALAADQAGRRIEGSYAKLAYNTGLVQELSPSWTLNAALRGQSSTKNLDSSERFSPAGPSGVRAYPVGEAISDEGWQASFNFELHSGERLVPRLFYDIAEVRLNQRPYDGWNAGNPSLPNRYSLMGAGAGLDWRIAPQALLTVALASPIGNNPAATASRNDSDARHRAVRGWVTLNMQF